MRWSWSRGSATPRTSSSCGAMRSPVRHLRAGFPYTDSTESSETTGRLGLTFFPSSNVTWYGTYSKADSPARRISRRVSGVFARDQRGPRIRAKTTLLDDRLRLNGALFYSEIETFQLSRCCRSAEHRCRRFKTAPRVSRRVSSSS